MHVRDKRGDRTLALARARCEQRGARLTELRALVLGLLASRDRPLGAYELLADLGRAQRRVVNPATVYRTLEFLVRHGLVVHLAARNAYVACRHADHDHAHLVFVCTSCGIAAERADRATDRRVDRAAREAGFVPAPVTIEIDGLCGACAASGVGPPSGPRRMGSA